MLKRFGRWLKKLFAKGKTEKPSLIIRHAIETLHRVRPGYADGIEIIEVDVLPAHADPRAEAFHMTEGGAYIYVNTNSTVYRAALDGDRVAIVKLASVIAHEAWHVRHGSDEQGAYATQLEVLRELSAPVVIVRGVEQAMRVVTGVNA